MKKFLLYKDRTRLGGKLLVYFKRPPLFVLKIWEIRTILDRSGSEILWRQLYDAFMIRDSKPPWREELLDENEVLNGDYCYDRLFLWDGIIFSQPGFCDEYSRFSVDVLKYPHFVPLEKLFTSEEGELRDCIKRLGFDMRSFRILERDLERKVFKN